MIQVYSPTNTNFAANGDMVLTPSECTVSVKLNGEWTLEMEHPIDADGRWSYITDQCVLRVPSFNGSQLFRVVDKTKTDTSISVTAEPIFMDARNDCFIVDARPTGKNGQEALDILTAVNRKYTGKSNITKRATAYYVGKNLIEALSSDDDNSFLNRWGGEILFDNYQVIINDRVGGDYGVQLLYGKNLVSGGTSEAVDFLDVCTRIYPKAYNGHAMTDNGYVDSPLVNSYPTVKARTITYSDVKMREDAQDDEDESVTVCDTQADLDKALKERCQADFEGGLDKPKVSLAVDMALLQNTAEYADYAELERVSLGDTVHLRHAGLNIVSDARVISLVYDCLRDRMESVEIGDYTPSYFSNVSSAVNRVESAIRPDGSLIAEKVAGFIDGAMASLRTQYNLAKKQDVLAILFENLDEDSPMYGALGIGTQGLTIAKERTEDGRAWDWTTAITANGIIADTIVTGLLSDKNANNYWNLDTGEFRLSATGAKVGDKTLSDYVSEASDGSVSEFVESVYTPAIDAINDKLDGQFETYYYAYKPTLDNEPASNWKTDTDRAKHEGDLFYNSADGTAYRFTKTEAGYEWTLIKDADITKALQDASHAQDTADHKRRVFTTASDVLPTPPYDPGDLWVQGGKGDIKVCQTKREKDTAALEADWVLASKYTDDSGLLKWIEGDYKDTVDKLTQQADKKAETWYQQDDPGKSWTDDEKAEHAGDLWYKTDTQQTFIYNGSTWDETRTTPPQEVFDSIDGKAQVFITTPTPPYSKGDLWLESPYSDILTCVTAKTAKQTFSKDDWKKRDKYIDKNVANSAANSAVDAQTQKSIFDKLTHNGETQGIYLQDNKLYINATYMAAGIITDKKGQNSWNLESGALTTNSMTANNVTANGTFKCGSQSDYMLMNSSGQLTGYRDGKQVGYIDYTGRCYNVDNPSEIWDGLQFQSNGVLRFSTPRFSVSGSGDVQKTTTHGFTGTITQPLISSITNRDDGGINWVYGNYKLVFTNGILTSYTTVGTSA